MGGSASLFCVVIWMNVKTHELSILRIESPYLGQKFGSLLCHMFDFILFLNFMDCQSCKSFVYLW